MRIRILVADESEASFYDVRHKTDALTFSARLSDPIARLHDRDLKSDRPGRAFDHAPAPGGRRGATPHHGIGSDRRPRKHEAVVFAQKIADVLEHARRDEEFDRLVLMAPPVFLGLLRKALPESVRASVAAEVAKDLVRQSPAAVQAHLPDDAFRVTPSAS